MARTESDKEDLITDATALVHRCEYLPTAGVLKTWSVVTIGFRRDGSLSVYFSQDPYFQFDTDGGLRRAYAGGFLYRSHGTALAEISRQRSETATTLQRTDLTGPALETFRCRMLDCITDLQQAITDGTLTKRRSVPEDVCLQERTQQFLKTVLARGTDFLSATVRA